MASLPKGGYGIVGRMAMRSDKVCKEAKAVYALLCSYTGGKHYCYPTVITLAKDLCTSERTIIRLTEELRQHGFCRKLKVGKDKRKTAYIPLHPYGGLDDTDGTYLTELDDTDGTQLDDTDGTLRITENNNNKAADVIIKPPIAKIKNRKPKAKIDLSEIEPVMQILRMGSKYADNSITINLRNLIRNEIEAHGEEYVCAAVRGRVAQSKASGKPLYLSTFFDPDRAEWRAECARVGESMQNAPQGQGTTSETASAVDAMHELMMSGNVT